MEYQVKGMHCGHCVQAVSFELRKIVGVTAVAVNLDAGTVLVTSDAPLPRQDVVDAVPEPAGPEAPERAEGLGRRLLVSIVLTLPLLLLAMVPALQFRWWPWVALALATPVIGWAGWPFHQAAWRSARHRTTTMDTLV